MSGFRRRRRRPLGVANFSWKSRFQDRGSNSEIGRHQRLGRGKRRRTEIRSKWVPGPLPGSARRSFSSRVDSRRPRSPKPAPEAENDEKPKSTFFGGSSPRPPGRLLLLLHPASSRIALPHRTTQPCGRASLPRPLPPRPGTPEAGDLQQARGWRAGRLQNVALAFAPRSFAFIVSNSYADGGQAVSKMWLSP